MIIQKDSVPRGGFYALEIWDYTANLASSSSAAFVLVPAGAAHPPALSKRSEKYYFGLEGSIQFEVDGEPQKLNRGDMCYIARGTRFSYRNDGPDPASVLLIHTPQFQLEDEVIFAGQSSE